MYKGLMPSNEKNVFEANILTVCPNRDQLGRRILVLELGSEYSICIPGSCRKAGIRREILDRKYRASCLTFCHP